VPIPTFVAAGTVAATATAGGVGPVSPGIPAGTTTNDIMILYVETGNQAVTAISGWTLVGAGGVAQATGLVTMLTIMWKRAGASETAPGVSIAAGGDHIVSRIATFRGCVTSGSPINATNPTVQNTASASVSIAGVTTTVADCMICAAVATGQDVASTANISGWTNASLASPAITENMDNWDTTGNGGGFGAAYGGKATAGATGATTATLVTANTQAMMTFALQGAAAPAALPRQDRINRARLIRASSW